MLEGPGIHIKKVFFSSVGVNPSVVSAPLFRGHGRMLKSLWCSDLWPAAPAAAQVWDDTSLNTCGAPVLCSSLVRLWYKRGPLKGFRWGHANEGGFELWTQSIWSGQGCVEIRCQNRMTELARMSSQSVAKACISGGRRQALGNVDEWTTSTCATFQLIWE